MNVLYPKGPAARLGREEAPAQISSGTIWMAPDGHSATQSPQPLQ
jgi:hypothetical protein